MKRRTIMRGALGLFGLGLADAAPLGVFGLAGPVGCKREGGLKIREAAALEGESAPAFDLPDVAGGRVSLSGMLEGGKPAVLVFYRGHW